MQKQKAVIIGFGSIAKLHAKSIELSEYVELYGVFDIQEAKMIECRNCYSCKMYQSYEEVLEDQEVDVVHICTPHYLHSKMAIMAIRANKHVVLEKPIAIKAEELDDLVDAYKSGKIKVSVMLQNRLNLTVLKMQELIQEEKLGKLLGVNGFITWHRNEEYYKSGDWRGKIATEGGGLIINQAPHILDLMNLLGGGIERVRCSISNKSLEGIIEVEDTCDTLFHYKNGAIGCFYGSNAYTPSSPIRLELQFEQGLYRFADNVLYKVGDSVEIIARDDRNCPGKSYWGNGHVVAIHSFYEALVENKPHVTDLLTTIHSGRLLLAMYESARSNKEIRVEQ